MKEYINLRNSERFDRNYNFEKRVGGISEKLEERE